ncbi:hypothetical protein [Niallia oryzisoli]
MKNNTDQTSEGLNQIMEIINAKGDEGEIKQIIDKSNPNPSQKNDNN